MTKGSSFSPKNVERMEEVLQESSKSTKTPVIVNETMKQHSDIDESTTGDWELDEAFLPSFTSKEKNSSENKKEGLGFQTFQLGSDKLLEQGVVRKLDLTQDSDDDYFSDGM
ncbi:hypothetical protein M9458_055173 [Cirrhinus mrigala]|uniref:Uncharacterized protein n=1 Tax=Cirrhinus mrigala TaxID=683832 RepID=A0ABD0MN10_CIRMR